MYSANQTITLNTILCCDPLVSDTACQIRAIYLVYLYHNILQKTELSHEEKQFINDCELLSQDILTIYQNDIQGFILTQMSKGDIKFIDEKGNELSKNQKTVLIANVKSKVASMGIEFIRRYSHASDDFQSFFGAESTYISSSKIRIHVLPCYLNTQLMLRSLKQNNFLLIVNLTRIHIHDNQKKIIGSAIICYRYSNNQLLAITANDTMRYEPAVTINMYSTLVLNSENHYTQIEPFFSCPELSCFTNGFRQLDLSKIIMMCAAAHEQLPKSVKYSNNDFTPGVFPDINKISEIYFNLEQCTKSQFQLMLHTAKNYGLINESMPPSDNHIFNPIRINHIYISSLAKLINQSKPLPEACNHAFMPQVVLKSTRELGWRSSRAA